MKATELQCYDLINVDGKPTMVYGIMARMNRVYDTMTNDISMRRCEPIPLTTEMLEKNGFVFRGDNDTMYGEYYLHNQSTFAIKVFNGYLVGMCMGEDLEFHYVHELQHLLRLCGLNELADNFKIN